MRKSNARAAIPSSVSAEPERSAASLADLYLFIEGLEAHGRLAPRTVGAYRVAVKSFGQVLALTDATNMRVLDLEVAVQRFRTETLDRFTDHTRNTYATNLRRAVKIFLTWIDSDYDWSGLDVQRYPDREPPRHELYRFPLRPNEVVTFRLPRDLTVGEAARLAAFIVAPTPSAEGNSSTSRP
jgi:hypothetical protein